MACISISVFRFPPAKALSAVAREVAELGFNTAEAKKPWTALMVDATLAALIGEASELDRRHLRLNKGELYPAELQAELDYRSRKMMVLYARLTRAGRG